ncbi:MAG: AbrB/MazE/SpoVT family DNA-binding domain-containing protein [Candidatus Njordarchaeales archaeon]
MSMRTLLKLGKSSLVVVLPKDWLNEMGLKNGDKVLVKQEDDGSLKIIPANISIGRTINNARLAINVDKCKDKGLVSRLLIANYLIGNDSVVIRTRRGGVSAEILKEIREIITKLRGFEIIEQKPNRILLQCVTDATSFSIDNLIGRMLSLLLSMIDYLRRGLSERKQDYFQEAIFIEEEIDRIYWFGVRQLIMVQRNRALAKLVGLESTLHIVGNRAILKALELAGDYIEEMAKDLSKLSLDKISALPNIPEKICELINRIEDIISDAVRTYNGIDIFLANNVLERINEITKITHSLSEEIMNKCRDVKTGVILVKLLTRLSDMAKSIGTVCEIVLNRAMENPSRSLQNCIYREF